jgi:uncharacterized protein involved in exopolysaccharide biosynthesis
MSNKNSKAENQQVMVPYGYMPYYPSVEEDEIDLRELWQTIVRRKKVIFIVSIISLLLAIGYILKTKPIYEAKALLQIGSIESKLIEQPNNLKIRLENLYLVNESVKKELPYVSKISVPKGAKSLIQLTVVGLDNQSTKKYITEVAREIEKDQEKRVQSYIDLQLRYLNQKRDEVKNIKKQIEQLSENSKNQKYILKRLIEEGKIKEANALSIEYSKSLEKLTNLQTFLSNALDKINEIEISLSPLNVKKSKIVGDIITYDHPVKPKKKLIIVVALVTGLILGVFMAFFIEFFYSSKKEES